ncbi:hypothetical protein Tco_0844984 [Tanacetum coccineum]
MWNDLILAHEGPSDTRDTKISVLRLKFNVFKALECEKVNGTFTRLKCLLNDLEKNSVIISQAKFNATDSDVKEDLKRSSEFIVDLNAEYHERALLANQKSDNHQKDYKGKYKEVKAKIVVLTKKIDAMSKGNSEKGLVAEIFDRDEESVSSEDEGTTKIKSFMEIVMEEPSVRKADARSGQWEEITIKKVNLENESLKDEISDLKKVIEKWTCSKVTLDQLLSEKILGNIVNALGGNGKRKEKISSKKVIFTKVDESLTMSIPEITSDSESKCETQEPLLTHPKLIGVAPTCTLNHLISMADLTLNMVDLTLNTFIPKKTKPTSDKVSPTHAIKKKTKTKSPDVPVPLPEKKANLSDEQLILTLADEVKSLKEQIKVPLDNSPSVSQTRSSKSSKGKQTTWFRPSKHCSFKNHLAKDCYLKLKCSTCGSTDHLTKEHLEQTFVNKTLTKLKAQSSVNPSAKKAPMISKPFKRV